MAINKISFQEEEEEASQVGPASFLHDYP